MNESTITGPSGRIHIGECFYKVFTDIGGILEVDESDGGTRRVGIKGKKDGVTFESITLKDAQEIAEMSLRKNEDSLWRDGAVLVGGKYIPLLETCVSLKGTTQIRRSDAVEIYNGPKEIGASVAKLTKLVKLHICTSRITTLSEAIGDVETLQHLWLHENALLESIPASVSKLSNLVKLEIVKCPHLKSLPNLAGLDSLRVLNAGDCAIERIPESIGELSSLHDLHMPRNNLSRLPGALPPTLTLLNLSGNNIEEIESHQIEHLVHLKELRLTGNKLKGIPGTIGRLARLTSLHLDDNLLESVPPEVAHLKHLAYMKLERNCLRRIPLAAFSELTMLESFDLEGNPLDDLVFAPYEDKKGGEFLELNPQGSELVDLIEERICKRDETTTL